MGRKEYVDGLQKGGEQPGRLRCCPLVCRPYPPSALAVCWSWIHVVEGARTQRVPLLLAEALLAWRFPVPPPPGGWERVALCPLPMAACKANCRAEQCRPARSVGKRTPAGPAVSMPAVLGVWHHGCVWTCQAACVCVLPRQCVLCGHRKYVAKRMCMPVADRNQHGLRVCASSRCGRSVGLRHVAACLIHVSDRMSVCVAGSRMQYGSARVVQRARPCCCDSACVPPLVWPCGHGPACMARRLWPRLYDLVNMGVPAMDLC